MKRLQKVERSSEAGKQKDTAKNLLPKKQLGAVKLFYWSLRDFTTQSFSLQSFFPFKVAQSARSISEK